MSYNDSYGDDRRGEGGYGGGGGGYGGGYGGGNEGGYGGGYNRPQDASEHGGGGSGGDNYYSGGGMSGGQDYRTGTGGGSGFNFSGGGSQDEFSGAMHHAQQQHSESDTSLFSSALGMLSGNKQSLADEDLDEDEAVQAHQSLYGGGGDRQHNSQSMGAGAAMQALKMFTGGDSSGGMAGGGSGTGHQGSQGAGSHNAFIGMAMGQASKLFDQQQAEGKVEQGADKQSVVNQAAKMAFKMYMKNQAGGGGGGPGGLMGMAGKFMQPYTLRDVPRAITPTDYASPSNLDRRRMSSYRLAPLSTGHDYRDPPSPLNRLYVEARFVYTKYIANLLATSRGKSRKRGATKQEKWKPRSLISLPSVLILCWVLVLWWGEVGTFRRNVNQCDWKYWERWPENASPHHLVLVADPQLVDPHTYPGRPWPLSTITRHHTDYYMRKSFTLIQETLDPTTVFFLGDLFDGGREWLPPGTAGSDPRWRNYGEDYWVKEYKRFGNIFFNKWAKRRQYEAPYTIHNHRIMADLPGNHDLGLGNGIKLPVRKRFNSFFGDGNSIDIVGNHTFISLDTVSLSAKGQPHPPTGSNPDTNQQIWGPAEDFLTDLKTSKHRLINRALRTQNAHVENDLMFHAVLDVNSPLLGKSVHVAPTHDVYIPSILLTHVPLYRAKDTPCGSLRERFPPTSKPTAEGEYLDKDPPNAIKVEAGIQYQNVLTPAISNEIIDKVEDVEYVFSGDDHDYCEMVHRGYTSPRGGIREITVKSFSWAMGVRKPGFLLVSLWNPLEENEDSPTAQEKAKRDQTVQTYLCLLPDQLTIFIRYVVFLVLTLFLLLVRAIRVTKANTITSVSTHSNGHVLPLTSKAKTEPPDTSAVYTQANGLTTRSSAMGRTRTASPSKGYGCPGTDTGINSNNSIHNDPLDERWSDRYVDDDDWGRRKDGKGRRLRDIGREVRGSLVVVATPVLVWYWYLVGGW